MTKAACPCCHNKGTFRRLATPEEIEIFNADLPSWRAKPYPQFTELEEFCSCELGQKIKASFTRRQLCLAPE